MRGIKKVLLAVVYLFVLEFAFAIHEYGHLREFQKRDIPIKEFSLGIGPSVYQHQIGTFIFSVRIVPLMAYVAPTAGGERLFEDKVSLWGKIAVHTAGIRNNFLCGVGPVLLLQILGWMKGNLSLRELAGTAAITPFKVIFRFFSLFIGCITAGSVNLTNRFLLSTGGINPSRPLKNLIIFNLILGMVNLVPLPPLDGSSAAQAILLLLGIDVRIFHIPGVVAFGVFMAFFMILQHQDLRMLEIESQDKL